MPPKYFRVPCPACGKKVSDPSCNLCSKYTPVNGPGIWLVEKSTLKFYRAEESISSDGSKLFTLHMFHKDLNKKEIPLPREPFLRRVGQRQQSHMATPHQPTRPSPEQVSIYPQAPRINRHLSSPPVLLRAETKPLTSALAALPEHRKRMLLQGLPPSVIPELKRRLMLDQVEGSQNQPSEQPKMSDASSSAETGRPPPSTVPVPAAAQKARTGAPMFREPFPGQQSGTQGPLFPVHTIMVQPGGQTVKRGNYTKAAAAAMSRRPPTQAAYFIQHRRSGETPDEGPTVKQHLQEQQKMKEMETMKRQDEKVQISGQIGRNETGQIIKTFTAVTAPTGSQGHQMSTRPAQQKRAPARSTDGAPPRSIPARQRPTQATTSLSANNRKLKVIVSPGVTTTFTTAQKQQLAQAPYVVSTQPLPPTAALPNQVVNQSVRPANAPGVIIQRVPGIKKDDKKAPIPSPPKKSEEKPSEFHVVKTVVPVTTPSIVKPLIPMSIADSPLKLPDPPLAILEGEEEELVKEKERKEEKKAPKKRETKPLSNTGDIKKFEAWVKNVKEGVSIEIYNENAEKREKERKKFTEKHIEQKRILDEQQRSQAMSEEKKKLSQKDLQEQRRQLEMHKQELEMQKLREKHEKEERERYMAEQQRIQQAPIIAEQDLYGPEELVEDPMIGQQPAPEFSQRSRSAHLQNLGIDEPLNMDDLISTNNEDQWQFQNLGHGYFQDDYNTSYGNPYNMSQQQYNNGSYQPAEPFPNTGYTDMTELNTLEPFNQQPINEPPPQEAASSSMSNAKPSLLDELFPDRDNSLDKLLSDPNILEDFPDMLNDTSFFDNFKDLDDPLCSTSKSSSSKHSLSPEIGMSLIDWVTNDDHVLGDDGDGFMGLRDETLENTASEYMNVCNDVDFSNLDHLDMTPMAKLNESHNETMNNPPKLAAMEQQSQPASRQFNICESQPKEPVQVFYASPKPEDSRPRRRPKSPKPMGKPDQIIQRQRSERRRAEDRSARQKKAEQDAKEKEREKQQIEADREKVKQIMLKEKLAFEAEKAAEALTKGPPGPSKPKKKSSHRSKARTSLQTPVNPIESQPVDMPSQQPIQILTAQQNPIVPISMPADVSMSNFEPAAAMMPPDNHAYQQPYPDQQFCIATGIPPPPDMMPSDLPTASFYPPEMAQQFYPPEAGMYPPQAGMYPPEAGMYPPEAVVYPPEAGVYPPEAGVYPPEVGMYPPAQFMPEQAMHPMMVQGEYPNAYPQSFPPEGYQDPMNQPIQGWYPQEDPYAQYQQHEVPLEMPAEEPLVVEDYKVITRTFSRDSGMDQLEETESPPKVKARRSNSFTNGLDTAKEGEELVVEQELVATYPFAPFGDISAVVPMLPQSFEEEISNFVFNCQHLFSIHCDLEKLILAGDASALEKFLENVENLVLEEDAAAIPTEALYNMLINPREAFEIEELTALQEKLGIDTTEQVKAEDTLASIEIPPELLGNDDPEVLQELEWKKLLCQALLMFTEEEKCEELWYMEAQVYEAEVAWDKHFAMKLKVIRDAILSLLYNSTSMLDEFARIAGKMLVVNEERKILARRLCHHQRNYIRRLQTASKRRTDAEKRRQAMIAAGLTPTPDKPNLEKTHVPATPPKSHKRKPNPNSNVTAIRRSVSLDEPARKRGRPSLNGPSPKKKERSVSTAGGEAQHKKSHKKKESVPKRDLKKDSGITSRPETASEEKKAQGENLVKATSEVPVTVKKVRVKLDPEARREARNLRKRQQRERAREKKKAEAEARRLEEAAQAEESKKKRAELNKRMKGYVYEEDVVEQESTEIIPVTEPEKPNVDPDAPIGVRKTTRRSAQYLNFTELSPRTSPDPEEEEEEDVPRRKTARPRASSGNTKQGRKTDEKEKTKRRGRPSKESLEAEKKVKTETEGRESRTPSVPPGEAKEESIEAKTEPPITIQVEDTTTLANTAASDQPAPTEEKERRRPRRAAAAIANSSILVREELLFDDEETMPKKKRRRTESSTPVRQSTRRKS